MDYLIIVDFGNAKIPYIVKNVDGKVTAISQAVYGLTPSKQSNIKNVEVIELFNDIKEV